MKPSPKKVLYFKTILFATNSIIGTVALISTSFSIAIFLGWDVYQLRKLISLSIVLNIFAILLSIFMLLLCAFGLLCVMGECDIWLGVYAYGMMAMIVIHFILLVIFLLAHNSLYFSYERTMQENANTSIPNMQMYWSNMQFFKQCCGAMNYTDWDEVPPSCCKKPNCNTKIERNINLNGCFTRFGEFMTRNKIVYIVSVIFFLFLSSVNVILSFSLREALCEKYLINMENEDNENDNVEEEDEGKEF